MAVLAFVLMVLFILAGAGWAVAVFLNRNQL